jgi:hypothetical protein
MAETLIRKTLIAYSTAVESTFNNSPLVATAYTSVRTKARTVPIPSFEASDDAAAIGNQQIGASEQFLGFSQAKSWEIQDDLNVNEFAVLVRRLLGAPDTVTEIEVGIAWKHSLRFQNLYSTGLQLPSMGFVWSNLGADNLFSGVCGNSVSITGNQADAPQYSLNLISSGKYKRIRDIASPVFGTLSPPAARDFIRGGETEITFNDGSPRSLTASQRAIAYNFAINNALNSGDRRMGSPRLSTTDACKGWYLAFLNATDQAVTADFTFTLDDAMVEFNAAVANTVITDFYIKNKGCYIGASTSKQYGVDLWIPKSNFRLPDNLGDVNDIATIQMTIFPLVNASIQGTAGIDIINGSSTPLA